MRYGAWDGNRLGASDAIRLDWNDERMKWTRPSSSQRFVKKEG
jgi:hypothetical protein